jgi:K(+)-stimulated pyrophosphate-energized sodium pump
MDLTYLALIGAIVGLVFALIQTRSIMKKSEGSEKVKKIAALIRRGANAYLKRQYRGVIIFFVIVTIILAILAAAGFTTFFVPVAFVTGGVFSALSGFIGMKIATYSNSRTVTAAKSSLNQGLRVSFSSGTVMGMTVVGLGLLLLTVWYFILKGVFGDDLGQITTTLLTCGMGASSMALFARVGGGIFTKAADVGADLVGKVEAGIPEDDPRNPAVIADNVGDNVGDVAGMGADLYESYIGSIISSAALAVAAGLGTAGIMIPLIMAAVGIVASVIGTFFVHTKENATQKSLLAALRKGVYISSVLIAIVSFFVVRNVLGPEHIGVFAAIISGLVAGMLIGFYTEYTTSDTYKPTQKLAESTSGGPATVIISGLSLGMRSTFFPIIIVAVSVLVSFFSAGGAENFNIGLYAVGISAVGMLSTLGITLATDAYGPVADNAGGIAEMAGEPPEVRERTDALDSLGNTTAASGKGFAIGSAALTALALIATFVTQAQTLGAELELSLLNPPLLMGLFIGVMMPFLFSSMTMSAVGNAAQKIVTEVRRQFREIKGLMEGKAEPDYEACVDICTRSAQKLMILPAIVTIIAPIIVGIVLGVNAVVGMLAGATASGFVLAIMMANSGGAWDNAKKYIEGGAHGGKGSDAHKAAVVGDTVGDPFKDTSGPSINILIKLLSIVSVVFASFIIAANSGLSLF